MSIYKTWAGKNIDILNLKEEDFCLEDIAHGLATYKRFGAALALNQTYNVANHSVLMAEYVLDTEDKIEAARYALMHDAAEAYLGDMPSPFKKYLPDYIKLEAKFLALIFKKYHIDNNYKKLIKEIDVRIRLDEVLGLKPKEYNFYRFEIPGTLDPLGIGVKGDISLLKSKQIFLQWCDYLEIKD